MRIQYSLLTPLCGLVAICFLWNGANAQIRQYNPNTGTTDTVQEKNSLNQPSVVPAVGRAPTPQAVAPRRAQTPPSLPPEVETGKTEEPEEPPLGKAKIFIATKHVGPMFGKFMQQVKEMEGLQYKVYVEEKEPAEYVKMLFDGGENTREITFTSDASGIQARQYKASNYRTIVYIDPTGARRRYDAIGEFDKFLRHVKRVKRKINDAKQNKK